MYLINEEHTVSGCFYLLDNLLQSFFEFPAVLGAGDQCPDIECQEPLPAQGLGDIARSNTVGDSLGNGGLADTGFTDEDGVILAPPAESLNYPLLLFLPSDNGVKLPRCSGGSQVYTQLIQGGGPGSGAGSSSGTLLR
ncbi:MAG: hypothetical protein DDT25_00917 [Chloroflexi bacterium]|nr:hypothetical protein [Chloroflexota bacterium]